MNEQKVIKYEKYFYNIFTSYGEYCIRRYLNQNGRLENPIQFHNFHFKFKQRMICRSYDHIDNEDLWLCELLI